jgi:tetratricopeptide (TPR) repeat protein
MTLTAGIRRAALIVWAAFFINGCAVRSFTLPEGPAVEVSDVPFYPQTEYQCGPAALATVLGHSGVSITPEALVPQVYVPAKRGSLQPEMLAAARRAGRLPYRLPPSQDALLTEVAAGHPVLVLQNLGFPGFPRWHYAVVVGFDPAASDMVLRSGTERRRRESTGWFFRTWERTGNWAFVTLQPGDVPATAEPVSYIELLEQSAGLLADADFDRAYAAALERWPADALVVFAAATHLHRRGELAAAEAQYRQLLAADPGHVGARNNLAEILRERGCLDAARDEARKALRYAGSEFREAVEDTLQSIARSTPADSHASACP